MGKVVKSICILLVLSLFTLAIAGCVTEALTLDITRPRDGRVVNEPTVMVKGTVSDLNATVTINGIEAPVGEFGFESIVNLTEGENTITIVATSGGETVTKTLTVTYTP